MWILGLKGLKSRMPKDGCLYVLRKPLLVRFCLVVGVLFSVFSIYCITSFGS